MPNTIASAASRLTLSQLAPGAMQSEIRAMTTPATRSAASTSPRESVTPPSPRPSQQAAIQAIHDGHNIYTRLDGIARLRQAIAAKQQRDYALTYDPETEVLVASGATGGLHAAAMALLNPGDEVLLFEPFYGYHVATLQSLRVKPVLVPLAEPDWALDLDALNAAITPRTRAILLNTPANPSGKVFSLAETRSRRRRLPSTTTSSSSPTRSTSTSSTTAAEHISPATLPGMRERTIVLSGFSKTFSVTGWRLGYVTADKKWMAAMAYFHDLTYVCAPAPFQHGAAAGLEQLPPRFYTQLAADHQSKRERILSALTAAGFDAPRPRRRLLRPRRRQPTSPEKPPLKKPATCSPPPA